VLGPGAWKGSWAFEAVVPLLERAGHAVHALTLTGLRPDDDEVTVATANLDTHAAYVLRRLDRAHLSDVTLVGHSYAGMVLAAAADRADGRIARLVHLDAFVPRDRDERGLPGGVHRRRGEHRLLRPIAGERRRSSPPAPYPRVGPAKGPAHGRPRPSPRREFVYCSGWEDQTPFTDLRVRLEADPDWQVHELRTGHNAMREAPQAAAAILLGEPVSGASSEVLGARHAVA